MSNVSARESVVISSFWLDEHKVSAVIVDNQIRTLLIDHDVKDETGFHVFLPSHGNHTISNVHGVYLTYHSTTRKSLSLIRVALRTRLGVRVLKIS